MYLARWWLIFVLLNNHHPVILIFPDVRQWAESGKVQDLQ